MRALSGTPLPGHSPTINKALRRPLEPRPRSDGCSGRGRNGSGLVSSRASERRSARSSAPNGSNDIALIALIQGRTLEHNRRPTRAQQHLEHPGGVAINSGAALVFNGGDRRRVCNCVVGRRWRPGQRIQRGPGDALEIVRFIGAECGSELAATSMVNVGRRGAATITRTRERRGGPTSEGLVGSRTAFCRRCRSRQWKHVSALDPVRTSSMGSRPRRIHIWCHQPVPRLPTVSPARPTAREGWTCGGV